MNSCSVHAMARACPERGRSLTTAMYRATVLALSIAASGASFASPFESLFQPAKGKLMSASIAFPTGPPPFACTGAVVPSIGQGWGLLGGSPSTVVAIDSSSITVSNVSTTGAFQSMCVGAANLSASGDGYLTLFASGVTETAACALLQSDTSSPGDKVLTIFSINIEAPRCPPSPTAAAYNSTFPVLAWTQTLPNPEPPACPLPSIFPTQLRGYAINLQGSSITWAIGSNNVTETFLWWQYFSNCAISVVPIPGQLNPSYEAKFGTIVGGVPTMTSCGWLQLDTEARTLVVQGSNSAIRSDCPTAFTPANTTINDWTSVDW